MAGINRKSRLPPVAGLGQCALDHLFLVPAYPGIDEKCEYRDHRMQGGGPVATALVTLSRLGVKTFFLGKTGDDDSGREIVKGLKAEKVNTAGVIKAPGRVSQVAYIAVEMGSAQRTIFWNRGSAFPFEPGEIRWDLIEKAGFLHLDGLHSHAAIEAARFARGRGIPVMLDGGTLREEMLPLLPFIDYLVVTEGFAHNYSHSDNPLEWVSALALKGAKVACVTMGSRGCIALEKNQIFRQKAFSVDAIDTTGCGDVFHGAFIFGILKQWPLRQTLEFASAVAALKCRKMGGREAIPSLEEALTFLRERVPSSP